MSNKQHFSYKGYTGSIEFSTEDMCLFGKVQMIQDLIMYDGETLAELKESFESSVDDYLEMCDEEGKSPDKPCSGTFNVRMSEDLHRKSIHESNILGITLNAFISKCVTCYFEENSIKKDFSLIDKKELMEHLVQTKNYSFVGISARDYDYSYSLETKSFLLNSDPLARYMNKGIENV